MSDNQILCCLLKYLFVCCFCVFLRNINYPGYIDHKRAHESFIVQLNKIRNDITEGNIVLGTQVMSILKNWLEDHIVGMDKKYGEFATKKDR